MAPDIARDFAAAGRMPDKHGIAQVQHVDQRGQVIGIAVHVVAVPGLVGTAMAAAVMGNDPKALPAEEIHLPVPGIGGQRPAMRKDDRLPLPPVLVEDPGSVCGREDTHEQCSVCLIRLVVLDGPRPCPLAGTPVPAWAAPSPPDPLLLAGLAEQSRTGAGQGRIRRNDGCRQALLIGSDVS